MNYVPSQEAAFFLQSMSDGIVLCDQQGKIAYLNPTAAKLFRTTLEDLRGRDLLPLFTPPWRDDVLALLARTTPGGGEPLLADLSLPGGKRMEVSLHCEPLPWDDAGRALFLRPGAEVTLSSWVMTDPESVYRDLLDNLPCAVVEIDPTGVILYANKRIRELLGYSPEELIGQNAENLVGLEARGRIRGALAQQLTDPVFVRDEYPFIARDGEIRYVTTHTGPILRDGKVACLRCVLADITESRRRESVLRASEARLAHVFRHLPIMVCALDDQGLPAVWNSECERVTGFSAEEIVGNPKYPSILSPVPAELRLALEGPSAMEKELRDYQVEMRTKLGATKTVAWSNVSRRVPIQGWSSWCVGVDVTVPQCIAQDLHNYLSFLETLMSTIPSPVFYKDTQGRYLGGNDAFAERIIGMPKIEIIGQTMSELAGKIPPSLEAIYKDADGLLLKEGGVQDYEAPVRCADGKIREFRFLKSVFYDEEGGPAGIVGVMFDQSEKNRILAEHRRLSLAVEQAPDSVIITDLNGIISYVNQAFTQITGYRADEAVGNTPSMLRSGKQTDEQYAELWRAITAGKVWSGRLVNRAKDGRLFVEDTKILPVMDSEGKPIHYIAIKRDISQVLELERQVFQAQKLEAVGRLAAGIAHEINTPTQYVGDNTRFLQDSFFNLLDVLQRYERFEQAATSAEPLEDVRAELERAKDKADMEFLLEELPKAVEQSLEGIGRITEIVSAMKEFSHPGSEEMTPFDLNAGVRSTTTVARNEWKYVANLELDLASNLPLVPCYPGDINQVVLNLVVNAAHAIGEKEIADKSQGKGLIRVQTLLVGEFAEIRVTDTGTGIPEHIREKIFDPFFTTKTVGKGTGQGLALAHAVVVDKHSGRISCESEAGAGATFVIALPLHGMKEPGDNPKER
jgi:PAS domain S-box-containing protein